MIKVKPENRFWQVVALDKAIFVSDLPMSSEEVTGATWWTAWTSTENRVCIPVGFGGITAQNGKAVILRVGVLPSYQGQGVMRKIVRAICRHAKSQGRKVVDTYVWAENIASMRTLAKLGFLPYKGETLPTHTGDLQTFISMHKVLTA